MKNGEHTVLIIDDQPSIRFLLGSFLKSQYEIVGFEDGFSAMQWLTNANFPDLILLDLNVPRLSGIDFLSQIKKSGFFQKIPVVIISGDDTKETKAICSRLGVHDYLTKPFDPVKLNALVKDILRRREEDTVIEETTISSVLNKGIARLRR